MELYRQLKRAEEKPWYHKPEGFLDDHSLLSGNASLKDLNRRSLVENLRRRGLDYKGTKLELQERILDWVQSKFEHQLGVEPVRQAKQAAERLLEQAGSTYAVGVNHVGQLGLGDSLPRESFHCIPALRGKNVDRVAAVSLERHKPSDAQRTVCRDSFHSACTSAQIYNLSQSGDFCVAITDRQEVFSWGGGGLAPLGFLQQSPGAARKQAAMRAAASAKSGNPGGSGRRLMLPVGDGSIKGVLLRGSMDPPASRGGSRGRAGERESTLSKFGGSGRRGDDDDAVYPFRQPDGPVRSGVVERLGVRGVPTGGVADPRRARLEGPLLGASRAAAGGASSGLGGTVLHRASAAAMHELQQARAARNKHLQPVQIDRLRGEAIVHVSAGSGHVVAVSEGGDTFVWGQNRYGQLGTGTFDEAVEPQLLESLQGEEVIDAATGHSHTVAITRTGQVLSWGNAMEGRLGIGATQRKGVPLQYRRYFPTPNAVPQFDPSLPPEHSPVPLAVPPAAARILQVCCGASHCIALSEGGPFPVFAWGSGSGGKLGLGDNKDRPTPTPVVALEGERVLQVGCGTWHSACIVETPPFVNCGYVHTWGTGLLGQLGLGDAVHASPLPLEVPGMVELGLAARKLSCGPTHNAIITSEGTLYTWGSNKYGSLGADVSDEHVAHPQRVDVFDCLFDDVGRGPPRSVACGKDFTIVACYAYSGPSAEELREQEAKLAVAEARGGGAGGMSGGGFDAEGRAVSAAAGEPGGTIEDEGIGVGPGLGDAQEEGAGGHERPGTGLHPSRLRAGSSGGVDGIGRRASFVDSEDSGDGFVDHGGRRTAERRSASRGRAGSGRSSSRGGEGRLVGYRPEEVLVPGTGGLAHERIQTPNPDATSGAGKRVGGL